MKQHKSLPTLLTLLCDLEGYFAIIWIELEKKVTEKKARICKLVPNKSTQPAWLPALHVLLVCRTDWHAEVRRYENKQSNKDTRKAFPIL